MTTVVEYGDPRLPARLWTKVYPEPTSGCWLWGGDVGGRDRKIGKGYGRIKWSGRMVGVHRLVVHTLVSPVPEDLDVDHLCRVTPCCNPAHLEAVTPSENTTRGYLARGPVEECHDGHPLADAYVTPAGRRQCRECQRTRNREYARRTARARKLVAA